MKYSTVEWLKLNFIGIIMATYDPNNSSSVVVNLAKIFDEKIFDDPIFTYVHVLL